MPFSPPNTFTTGQVLEGTQVEQNETAARRYINVDIVEADIQDGVFTSQDLQQGEAFQVTNDSIFMTGDEYSNFYAQKSSIPQARLYHTSTVKRQNPMSSMKWVSVPGLAKQIYLENEANVLIEVSFFTYEDENNDCRGAVFPWVQTPIAGETRSDGQESQFLLAIDGSYSYADDETKCYAFNEPGATTVTFGKFSIMHNLLGYQGGATGCRKFCNIQYLAKNLSQGWHNIAVLCDPRNEWGYVAQRTFEIEVFYKMGYDTVDSATIATNRKLPETQY